MDILTFWNSLGLAHLNFSNVTMMLIGSVFVFLAATNRIRSVILISMGIGMILGNLPALGLESLGLFSEGSIFYTLYQYTMRGVLPSLILLGIGTMINFSVVLAAPRVFILSLASPIALLTVFLIAHLSGFSLGESTAFAMVNSACTAASVFFASIAAPPKVLGIVALVTALYVGWFPQLRPIVVKLMTTGKERRYRVRYLRPVSKKEKIILPIVAILVTGLLAPGAVSLLVMFFLGNLLRESIVAGRIIQSIRGFCFDVLNVLLGVVLGMSIDFASLFSFTTLFLLVVSVMAFVLSIVIGILLAKLINLFAREKMNPLVAAGGPAIMTSTSQMARVLEEEDKTDNSLYQCASAVAVVNFITSIVIGGLILNILV